MPLVYDFVPIQQPFETAATRLLSGGGTWLAQCLARDVPSPDGHIELGAPRSSGDSLLIPMRFSDQATPFRTLDADLRIEPVTPTGAHLSLSGSYEGGSLSRREALHLQRSTEAWVRGMLTLVAAHLAAIDDENGA